MKKQQTFFHLLETELQKKKKIWKKQKLLFQTKVFFTLVLPFIITVLFLKVVQTWLRIHIRKAAQTSEEAARSSVQTAGTRKELSRTSFRPEFITPEPAEEILDRNPDRK